MAKNNAARKSNPPATAGTFAPLPLTPAEKKISRNASRALTATVTDINGMILTLTTPAAQKDYFTSLVAWGQRCLKGINTTTKVKTAGAAA